MHMVSLAVLLYGKLVFRRRTYASSILTSLDGLRIIYRQQKHYHLHYIPPQTSTPPPRGRALHLRLCTRTRTHRDLCWFLPDLLGVCSRLRAVPIVGHLRRQHRVQREARHEPVEYQLIIHLLERSEDARERSDEVVEDLTIPNISL